MKESVLWPILQQARTHATNGFNFDVDKFHNKFAELIVEECVSICQDIDGEDSLDGRCARQDCSVEIRGHFGVEE